MRILLDSHTLFWSIVDRSKLSSAAKAVIGDVDSEVWVSVASAWELSIKVGAGKWPEAREIVDRFETEVKLVEFRVLPISIAHVRAAGLMKSSHRDPFDRLLAAQAIEEGLILVTADARLALLGVECFW